jgi:hypothetical protein
MGLWVWGKLGKWRCGVVFGDTLACICYGLLQWLLLRCILIR